MNDAIYAMSFDSNMQINKQDINPPILQGNYPYKELAVFTIQCECFSNLISCS